MGYAVYHMEKGSSTSGGMGNHIDRTEGKEHTYPHANPEKKHLNIHFDVHEKRNKIPLHQAIEKRISEGYKGEKAIRKDAVKFCTHVLTGSHEKMKEIFADKEKSKEWIQDNYRFLAKEFGKENIVRFTLHLDEKTPHLHAVTIPLTSDGRLSAKEIIGNKQSMKNFQTRYAAEMEKYGLERGIENTGIKHENAQQFYSRINEANKIADKDEIKASKNLLGIYKSESVEELENSLKSLKTGLYSRDKTIEDKSKTITSVLVKNSYLKEQNAILKRNSRVILSNENIYKQEKEKLIEKTKKDVLYDFKIEIQYQFGLKFESSQERIEYLNKVLNKVSEKLEIHNDLKNKIIEDRSFVMELFNSLEKREYSRNQDKGQGFSR